MDNASSTKFIDIFPLLLLLSLLLLGVAAGTIISDKFGPNLNVPYLILRLIELMFIMFMMLFVQIILHETGHLVAGLVRGWSFLSFMVMNVIITFNKGRLHVSHYGISGADGQCIMVPPEKGDTDFGIALYNAGGILMNLFTGVLSLLLFFLLYDFLSYEAVLVLMYSAFWGIIFAVQNTVPMIAGGLPNDGRNIMELRKDTFSTEVFIKSLHIVAAMQKGEVVNNLPAVYMCEGKDIDYNNPMHVMALNLDLEIALAKKDFVRAGMITDSAMANKDKIVGAYLKDFKKEYMFLSLMNNDEKYKVENLPDDDMYDDMKKFARFRPDYMRLEYTLAHLYEHDEEKASVIYKRFLKLYENYYAPGEAFYEKELVEIIRRQSYIKKERCIK